MIICLGTQIAERDMVNPSRLIQDISLAAVWGWDGANPSLPLSPDKWQVKVKGKMKVKVTNDKWQVNTLASFPHIYASLPLPTYCKRFIFSTKIQKLQCCPFRISGALSSKFDHLDSRRIATWRTGLPSTFQLSRIKLDEFQRLCKRNGWQGNMNVLLLP